VVVTGASGGLGRALCVRFADPQALLGLHYASRADRVERVAADARARGARTYSVHADFSDPGAVARVAEKAAEQGTPVDVLVLNAGIVHEAPLVRTGSEDWDRTMAVNLRAPAALAERFFDALLRPGAHVVAVASMVGLRGRAGLAAYAAAKAALIGFARDAAARYGPRDVCVNAVVPGVLDTGMTTHIDRAAYARMCAENALGRPTTCAEVAEAVAVLTRLRHVSGQVVCLDSRPWPESSWILRPLPG
jgi:3-oxoacyl-[acyl-carrier protein] reductase